MVSINEQQSFPEDGVKFSRVLPARIYFLAFSAIAVFVAGILFPVRTQLLAVIDGLWILCLCLTAAVFMLSMMTKNISELSGLASMLIYTSILKFATAVISAKFLMTKQLAGDIIEKIGFMLNSTDTSVTAVIIMIGITASAVIVFMATSAVIKRGLKYSADSMPFEYVSVQADLNAGIISDLDAAVLKSRIVRDAGFYLSMSSAAKFIRFDAVFGILVIASTLTGSITSISATASTDGAAMEASLALMLGVSVLIYLPAILLAVSASAAVSKTKISTTPEYGLNKFEQQIPRSVEIKSETIELLNPDFMDVTEKAETKNRTV